MIWNHEIMKGVTVKRGLVIAQAGLATQLAKSNLKTPPGVQITSLLIEKIYLQLPQRHRPIGILSAQVDLIE